MWREVEGGSLGKGVMFIARGGRFTEKVSKCTQTNLLIPQALETEANRGGARLKSGSPA